jgi:hypothetical protein
MREHVLAFPAIQENRIRCKEYYVLIRAELTLIVRYLYQNSYRDRLPCDT